MDIIGSGFATFSLKDAAKYLDVSVRTIRRYLKEGLELGYFQYFKTLGDGRVYVRYTSWKKIAKRLGIRDIGFVAWCDRSQMRNLKASLTQHEMKQRQDQSLRQAKKENAQRRTKTEIARDKTIEECDRIAEEAKQKYYSPEYLLASPESKKGNRYQQKGVDTYSKLPNKKQKPTVTETANQLLKEVEKISRRRTKAVVLYRGKRFAIVTLDFLMYGASQNGLGADLGRCNSTIRRRLKDLERKQILQVTGLTPEQMMGMESQYGFIVWDGVVYRLGCNIYKFGKAHQNTTARNRQKRYNKFLEASTA